MNADQLRALQAPLKQQYKDDPAAATITLRASGEATEALSCKVETGKALVEAGLHPATGGDGSLACSGDMLLEALVACAGVTLRAVATAIGVDLRRARVTAEGDLDFRGTLGVAKDAPVGFRDIRVRFDLDTDAGDEQRATLLRLTERYCVVLQTLRNAPRVAVLAMLLLFAAAGPAAAQDAKAPVFRIEEATIAQIQQAIRSHRITTVGVVEAYLRRIKAYNGTCVNEPNGILGVVSTIPHARQINALSTLNLRPAAREQWGFDARKARSLTDKSDAAAAMPDALEVAAAQDRALARTGKLAGPLHGVVIAIKDQYDTFDMRTTSGGDADYANDRPPDDATFVKKLRDAGAIILAKANLAEYAVDGARSSFGGTFCNPYDTEREPGMSSAGSGSSVAANLVTCAIGEETVVSVRWPASVNSLVGLAPTKELVSTDGMIGAGLNMRVGPMCRTVEDTARILDVIAGYDPKDEMTVYSVGRTPANGYTRNTATRRLDGVRIGVLREYLRPSLVGKADEQSIALVERAIADLRKLGATIVDPGPDADLFTPCLTRYAPRLLNSSFARQYPQLFAGDDQIAALVDLSANPARVPQTLSLRTLNAGGIGAAGEGRFEIDRYLRERGDANIKSNADLIAKSRFYSDPNFPDRKQARERDEQAKVLDTAMRMQGRAAVQTMLLQCMQEQKLDALVSPMSTVPPRKLTNPREPVVNGRNPIGWSLIGQQGFPAITVPAGFTTEVWDRVRDGANGTRLAGPVAAALPVGVDFIARPFGEPLLFRIAAAYEAATHHRRSPPEFGPVPTGPAKDDGDRTK